MAAYGAMISLWKTLYQLHSDQQIKDHHFGVYNLSLRNIGSLQNIFSQLRSPPQIRALDQQIIDLDFGVYCLQRFLDDNRDVNREFEILIRDAIYEAQDVIDSQMLSAHFVSPAEAETSNKSFGSDLKRLIQSINSIVEMTKSEEFNHHKISDSVWKTSDEIEPAKWNQLMGRDEDFAQLSHRLLRGYEALELVSVIGIAGMGKTNLAICLFKYIKEEKKHFDVCGWCKVHIEYNKRNVLLGLLVSMMILTDEIYQKTDDQLQKHLYDFLKYKKYLVMLDDVRDVVVWNDLKDFLPNHHNGSRILLTTRDEVIAGTIANSAHHRLTPLTNDVTFDLLQQIVFLKDPCPPELFDIAKKIAESCKGLPRAVAIVGRLLRCANLRKEYWELVLSSIVTCDGYEDIVEALVSLTYNHLPQYLRACLLYMAMFPYEYSFDVFKLIQLWIVEGFLHTGSKSEMGTAWDCLMELSKRGLIIKVITVDGANQVGKIYEEVFHDFSLRTATEESFCFTINKDTKDGSPPQKEDSSHDQWQRLFVNKSIIPLITQDFPEHRNLLTSISTVRSLLYYGPEHQYPLRPWLELNLVKVLDILKIRFYSFPPEIFILFLLRYLSLSYNGQLPAEVCKLCNLQLLIVSRYLSVKCSGVPSYLPVEIWNMKELTHLQVMGSDIPLNTDGSDIPLNTDLRLEKLFSLLDVSSHSCTQEILERLPNLYELGVRIESLPEDESLSFFSHLNILDHLDGFKCIVVHPNIGSQVAPCSIPAFPGALGELTLSGCGFPWEYMEVIAALRKLRHLQLQNYAFHGPVWKVKKDEFPSLHTLWLEDVDLEDWILEDKSCFPEMMNLFMKHCYKLHKIPDAIGDFPKLTTIQVVDCSASAMQSFQAIKENPRIRNDSVRIMEYSSLVD